MGNRLPYRIMGWVGILNILLIAVPIIIAPIPPLGPGADLGKFYTTYRAPLLFGDYLGVIELPVNLLLLIFVAAILRRAERSFEGWLWLLVGGAGMCEAAVFTVLNFCFIGPLVVTLGKASLLLLVQLGLYGLDICYSIQAILLGAIGAAVLRLRCMPAWLGYLAWLAALCCALGTLGLFGTAGPFGSTSFFTLFIAGFALPGWLLLASLYWLLHPTPQVAVLAPAQ